MPRGPRSGVSIQDPSWPPAKAPCPSNTPRVLCPPRLFGILMQPASSKFSISILLPVAEAADRGGCATSGRQCKVSHYLLPLFIFLDHLLLESHHSPPQNSSCIHSSVQSGHNNNIWQQQQPNQPPCSRFGAASARIFRPAAAQCSSKKWESIGAQQPCQQPHHHLEHPHHLVSTSDTAGGDQQEGGECGRAGQGQLIV